MLCPTPTRAARWTTASTPSTARATASGSRTSPTRSSTSELRYPGRSAPACTCGVRSSSARTRYPGVSSWPGRCEPMKPAPPVTRIVSAMTREVNAVGLEQAPPHTTRFKSLPSGADVAEMGSVGVAAPASRIVASRAFLEREGLLVVVCGALTAFWAFSAPYWLEADSWLTLLGGREIHARGIPRTDELAVITHGQQWVDQQWLAQVFFWNVNRLGGIRLDLLVTVALLVAPLVLAVRVARTRGASPISIVPFLGLSALPLTSFLRAQLFSQLFFVVLFALLVRESREPSRRVFLAFPLLVLWANLHGAVVVGAALVVLLGACELAARRPWPRAAALLVAQWLCLVATPYGLDTLGYYKATIANPVLRQTVTEWMSPTFTGRHGLLLFLLAGAAIALVVKRPRDLTRFELAALVLTLAGAMLAVRSIAWFAYDCLMLLPPLREAIRKPAAAREPNRLHAPPALVMAVVAFGAIVAIALTPTSKLTRLWPSGPAAAVRQVMRADPNARVLAAYRHGDWLLYEIPELRGRIAFDGRWELLETEQAKQVFDYFWQVGDWESLSDGYRLIVLDPKLEPDLVKTYDARRDVRVLYRDARFVVYDRGAAADAGST